MTLFGYAYKAVSMTTATTSPLQRTVTAEIKAEMARQGRVQRHIGECLGLSSAQVSERLSCKVDLKLGEVDAIAAYLGVPVAQFVCPVRIAIPKKASAGRSSGRRSTSTPNPHQ